MTSKTLCSVLSALIFGIGFGEPLHAGANAALPPSEPPQPDEPAALSRHDGLFQLDYQSISLPDSEKLDLIGYHILTPVTEWAYVGLGGYAPFLEGDFGGFMAFGVLAHAQIPISDTTFATAGLSFGGGGGGKSVSQSAELSGTGGYARGYLGFGHNFGSFSLGANISHMAFFKSAINNTQLDLFFQKPFAYQTGAYGQSGDSFTAAPPPVGDGFGSMVSFGLDNYMQINPTGAYKGTINALDIQYANFISKNAYWYYALGVGYKGLPIYNQVVAGIGARAAISGRFRLYGQLGIGSGGYAPTIIDTGSGLLLYPKLSAEFLVKNNTGIALTAGYVHALDGTAQNFTLGASLNHYFNLAAPEAEAAAPFSGRYNGYRFSLSHETVFDLSFANLPLDPLNMITIQADKIISNNFYIPLRAAISYQSYRGYPGYGEISAGIGVQNSYMPEDRFQVFGEFQAGANVQGSIARAVIGLDIGLHEGLALRATLGQTRGNTGFRSTSIALGLTSRFSLLNI